MLPPMSFVVFIISSSSVRMYLVLYREISISKIIIPTKAEMTVAAIPIVPIGVKKAGKKKNTVTAAIKTTKVLYDRAIVLETSGLLIMSISTEIEEYLTSD